MSSEFLSFLRRDKHPSGLKLLCKFGFAIAVFALTAASAFSADVAILRNGFTIRHEHREMLGQVIRLYLTDALENFVDISQDQIVRFEKIEEPPVPVDLIPAHTAGLDELIAVASKRNNIDPNVARSLIRVESRFNATAVSPKGAQGLMQLMPHTAASLGVKNPFDPAANVDGGLRYLRDLLARYNNNLVMALAAYNAGPERVRQYRGVPPYLETRAYILRVLGEMNRPRTADPNRRPRLTQENAAPR
jgi:soluble lytic murein transglycosylase-like protein